jgi:hypothetical protein
MICIADLSLLLRGFHPEQICSLARLSSLSLFADHNGAGDCVGTILGSLAYDKYDLEQGATRIVFPMQALACAVNESLEGLEAAPAQALARHQGRTAGGIRGVSR